VEKIINIDRAGTLLPYALIIQLETCNSKRNIECKETHVLERLKGGDPSKVTLTVLPMGMRICTTSAILSSSKSPCGLLFE